MNRWQSLSVSFAKLPLLRLSLASWRETAGSYSAPINRLCISLFTFRARGLWYRPARAHSWIPGIPTEPVVRWLITIISRLLFYAADPTTAYVNYPQLYSLWHGLAKCAPRAFFASALFPADLHEVLLSPRSQVDVEFSVWVAIVEGIFASNNIWEKLYTLPVAFSVYFFEKGT